MEQLLQKIDMQTAMVCIHFVHHQQVEQARILCAARGIELTEDDVYNVASGFREIFQVDASREERPNCFLCRQPLPAEMERLCSCFRSAQKGRFIDPITPQTIGALRDLYPNGWRDRIIETIQCVECGALESVSAGVAASRFDRGLPWRTPRKCMLCYKKHKAAHAHTSKHPVHKGVAPLRVRIEGKTFDELRKVADELAQPSAKA